MFSFHRPETLAGWLKQEESLAGRFHDLPRLSPEGLRDCQYNAIKNLEESFRNNRPKALVQMATGAGKTFTAITEVYRLLKFANAKRILFLVDTRNLGEQAETEFINYIPQDENRKFPELYVLQRLQSAYIPTNSQVCISTIQRLYSILKGEELDETKEMSLYETEWKPKEPLPVVYNPEIPIEFFDFIIIDECHRSIYNLWKQVLDYFDAYLIGLTATPDKRTYGFFNQNVVSEYSHEDAVADGVNVGYEVYTIETEITKEGAKLEAKEYVDVRNRLTREKRWTQLDEDLAYSPRQLDKDVVNVSTIRSIIRTFRDKLREIFPLREEVPKTLIFAKTDSHADDIIQIVREEFNEGNAFCKKVTYKAEEDPKSVLAQFRNEYNPRIAVTVDMIATGTDVRPLECLLFMRDVKSRSYFEQMKGRGTRTYGFEDMKLRSPSIRTAKTHFVIVDAVGVTKSVKTDSRPLERKRSVPLKALMEGVMLGARDEDTFLSLAGRLARLDKQMEKEDKEEFSRLAGGKTLTRVIHLLLNPFDPDKVAEEMERSTEQADFETVRQQMIDRAKAPFNAALIRHVEEVRKNIEQVMDNINIDRILFAGWDKDATARAEETVKEFREFLEKHKDEITALSIFYDQPYRRRELTYKMVKEVLTVLKKEKPLLAPHHVWGAYSLLDQTDAKSPVSELTTLVSLIRRVTGLDQTLTPYDKTVDRNFRQWVFKKQEGAAVKFNREQMDWLRMIKDHIATSIHLDRDDLDNAPFDAAGGIGKMYQLFGDETQKIMDELNEVLVA